jgi:hypothetical protein
MAVTREQVAKLYVATFDRAPDAAGLDYWVNDSFGGNPTLEQIASSFFDQPETQAKYGAVVTDYTAFVTAMYQNLFERDPDADGLAYWVADLEAGNVRPDQMIIALINGAEAETGDPADAAVLANKTEVGLYFADTLGLDDVDAAYAVMDGVTGDDATVTAAMAEADYYANLGDTFVLTTSSDSVVGTNGNDTFDASTLGTLNSSDVILDSSTSDQDILNATVTSNSVAARIQNVETVNVTGKYVTTGLDLTNSTGIKELNLDTVLQGGTATVTAANSINAEKIVAGDNINTLNVTSLTSGTRDTVIVDGGSANVNLNGAAAGADKYDVTIAAGKTLTLDANMDTAGDAATVNATGDFTLVGPGSGANLSLTINNNGASAITVTENDTALMAKALTLSGNAITLDIADVDAVDTLAVTSSAANSTIKLNGTTNVTATATGIDLNKAVVGTVDVAADLGSNLVVNEGTVVNLTANQTGAQTINIDNEAGTLTTGTLLLNVSEDQTAITTDSKVDTLLIEATPDEASDTVDANGNTQQINIGTTTLDSATTVVVAQGSADLDLGALVIGNTGTIAAGTAEVISAGSMTGNLTIGSLDKDAKIYAGSGNDLITTANAGVFEIHGGAGNDTIDVTGAAAGTKVYGDAGDDKITTGVNGATVDGGADNDTFILNGTDTVTTGTGSDIIKAQTINNASTITDFAKGADTIVVSGTLAGSLDVTNMSHTNSTYDIDADGADDDLTLTGVTATDLSDSIQLNVTAFADGDVIAGAKNDTITVNGANTIVTGAGSDTVVVGSGETTAAVSDFTTGTDKIVLTGAAGGAVDLTSVTPSTGTYTFVNHAIKLTGHTETDLTSMVQLGTSTAAFAAAGAVTGGAFDDYIDVGAAGADTVNFIDNGGFDTITNFTAGTDKLSFDAMTGMNASATAVALTQRTNDAVDGNVYILDGTTGINNDTISTAKLTAVSGSQIDNVDVTINSDVFVNDVLGYLNNAMGTTTGETYVVAINGLDVDNSGTKDTLLYKVAGNTTGITANDIQLVGIVIDASVAVDDIA